MMMMLYNTRFESRREQDGVLRVWQMLSVKNILGFVGHMQSLLFLLLFLLIFPLPHPPPSPPLYVLFLAYRPYKNRPWVCHSLTVSGVLPEIKLEVVEY